MNLWDNSTFQYTAFYVILGLILIGLFIFPFRKKNTHTAAAWASVQSWLIGAPIIFVLLGSGDPWPVVGITFIAILGAKEFFQLTGMYHRGWFVSLTYLFIIALGYVAYKQNRELYNTMPMIFLASAALIPLILNTAKNMVQFICLSLLSFLFMGWAFMHTAWIVLLPHGTFLLIYLIIISEVTENVSFALTHFFGKRKIAKNIAPRRTIEGILGGTIVSLSVGYLLRDLLPTEYRAYWLNFSVTAILVGSLGNLILATIRRDLGAKDFGLFIIGRGGVLNRLDQLICTTPIYYYVIVNLSQNGN